MTRLACRKTREALGIDVANNIVVIDEAHNLIPAINGAHSVSLSVSSLAKIVALLDAYLSQFQSRLGAAKATAVTSAKRLTERLQLFLTAGKARAHFVPIFKRAVQGTLCRIQSVLHISLLFCVL